MASKKYKLILMGFLILIGSGVFAQKSTSVYDPYDSSVIRPKTLPQQNEFWNHNYDFPAKPRNQWEIGASLSDITASSDVSAKFPVLPSFEVHVRKALGYVFSLRAQYVRGIAEGQNWQASDNFINNPAYVASGIAPAPGQLPQTIGYKGTTINAYTAAGQGTATPVFYNYKSLINDLSLQGLVTLNNIRFHKQKTGMTIYGGGGIGLTWYHTMIDAGRSDGTNYASLYKAIIQHYDSLGGLTYSNRKDILKSLKNGINGIAGQDGIYESRAETDNNTEPSAGGGFYTLRPSATIVIGMEYKLSSRINLQLEDRETFIKDDLLDGQEWAEQGGPGTPVLTSGYDTYNVLSLGLNFNLGSKAVEPLWWLNPLDYAYSELDNPRHIKFPKPVLDDDDGDGVINQFDLEPNTPKGCPVDTHGVSLDTDGDGVPDCKDKQKITPTECQPVDSDGVGTCPPPACCAQIQSKLDSGLLGRMACAADYPSITFRRSSMVLSREAKALLATVASKLKASPTCNIVIVDYPAASKPHQSLARRRLDAIEKYLIETLGISTDRITTDTQLAGGDENTFDIKSK